MLTRQEMVQFLELAERFRRTPIVDDDFPAIRNHFDAHLHDMRRKAREPVPTIVCLCGSTRFKQAFIEANYRETMAGKIVLSVGWFSHADAEVYTPTEAEKQALDELHLRKIDWADEVLILNDRIESCLKCKKLCDSTFHPIGATGYSNSKCCRADTFLQPYIGESTKRELDHARRAGKVVRFLNPEK